MLDHKGDLLAPPRVTVQGLGETGAGFFAELGSVVEKAVAGLAARERREDGAVGEAVRLAIRRALKASHGKRPATEVHVVRV